MMRVKQIEQDPSIPREQKSHFFFHLREVQRIHAAVLTRADLPAPPRRVPLNTAIPARLHNWLRRAQWELWRWKANLSNIFWTSRIDKAWHQVFAETAFRKKTMENWCRYLQIRDPCNSP